MHLNHEGEMFEVKIKVEAGEGMSAKIPVASKAKGKGKDQQYSLHYLKAIAADAAKISGLGGEVNIQFEDKFPLLIEWNSGSYGTEYTYFLAPRVPND